MSVELRLISRHEVPSQNEVMDEVSNYAAVGSVRLCPYLKGKVDDAECFHFGPIDADGFPGVWFELVVFEDWVATNEVLGTTSAGAARIGEGVGGFTLHCYIYHGFIRWLVT